MNVDINNIQIGDVFRNNRNRRFWIVSTRNSNLVSIKPYNNNTGITNESIEKTLSLNDLNTEYTSRARAIAMDAANANNSSAAVAENDQEGGRKRKRKSFKRKKSRKSKRNKKSKKNKRY
jgi:hypothetical protein